MQWSRPVKGLGSQNWKYGIFHIQLMVVIDPYPGMCSLSEVALPSRGCVLDPAFCPHRDCAP